MRRCPLAAAVVLTFATSAPAQFTFTKIADTSTAVPGGSGTFTGFDSVAVSGTTVAFRGFGSSGQQGVYVGTAGGSLGRAADKSTGVPGGTGTFSNFSPGVSVSGTTVAFQGQSTGSITIGIYTGTAGGTPSQVADTTTGIPGGSGTFTSVGFKPSIDGTTVAFLGLGSGSQQGVYTGTAGGTPSRVADTTTGIPGGTGTFANFSNVALSGATVAYVGSGSSSLGVYTGTAGGTPSRVADRTTSIPGGSGTFTNFDTIDGPAISGSTVAFRGQGLSSQVGIYTGTAGGSVARVADKTRAIPGGTGNFSDLLNPSISGTTVAFYGTGSSDQRGIYFTGGGGTLTKLIAAGDPLDGKTVSNPLFVASGLSGTSVAFRVLFTDSTTAIYHVDLAPIPEPGLALGLAAAGLGGVRLVRRRSPVRDGVVA